MPTKIQGKHDAPCLSLTPPHLELSKSSDGMAMAMSGEDDVMMMYAPVSRYKVCMIIIIIVLP